MTITSWLWLIFCSAMLGMSLGVAIWWLLYAAGV